MATLDTTPQLEDVKAQASAVAASWGRVSTLQDQLALAQGQKAALDSAAATLQAQVPAVRRLEAAQARLAALRALKAQRAGVAARGGR